MASKIINRQVAQKLLEARAEAIEIDWKELLKTRRFAPSGRISAQLMVHRSVDVLFVMVGIG